MTFAFLLDGLIAALLVATIVWSVVLNRRLKGLRRNQEELSNLIGALNQAAERAEAGIAALRANAEEAGASLQSSITQAERLNEELTYLAKRGSRLAQRLEGVREEESAFAPQRLNTPSDRPPERPSETRREIEAGLLKALRAAR